MCCLCYNSYQVLLRLIKLRFSTCLKFLEYLYLVCTLCTFLFVEEDSPHLFTWLSIGYCKVKTYMYKLIQILSTIFSINQWIILL